MKVVVKEFGDPPPITTPARMNARAGAKVLADLMAEIPNVDMGEIVLDWKGDGITPVMIIRAAKSYPGWKGKWIYMDDWIIDIDEAFGRDHMDNGGLQLMAEMISSLFYDTEEDGVRRGIV